ncbi:MAG: peptidase S41, partial [Rhodobacteraceae bacterium]|nr:peptidase S41 [Paracoccaceae bacterium]
TTARYYTPSGRSIQATGIEPDIEVRQASVQRAAPPVFRRAEADLPGALENDTSDPAAAGNDGNAAEQTQDTEDYQLARALDLLQGIAIYQRSSLN